MCWCHLQVHQPSVAQKVRRKYQQQQKRKQKMKQKNPKGKLGRPRKTATSKKRSSQTLTKLKDKITNKKKKQASLAVNALENATMQALKVCVALQPWKRLIISFGKLKIHDHNIVRDFCLGQGFFFL